jgi:hypothetical protein
MSDPTNDEMEHNPMFPCGHGSSFSLLMAIAPVNTQVGSSQPKSPLEQKSFFLFSQLLKRDNQLLGSQDLCARSPLCAWSPCSLEHKAIDEVLKRQRIESMNIGLSISRNDLIGG